MLFGLRTQSVAFLVGVGLLCGAENSEAATRLAASCSWADVNAAVTAASNGDTVLIPNGSCTWTNGIKTTKQIWIRAQNYTVTDQGPGSSCASSRNVRLTNSASVPLFEMASGESFHVSISGIAFVRGSGSNNHVRFTGSGSKVPLLSDIYAEIWDRGAGNSPDIQFISWLARGGVWWNSCLRGVGGGFGGDCCPSGGSVVIQNPNQNGFTSASTMGALDTTGTINVYIEDVDWKDFGQSPDGDQRARFVIRYSLLDGTAGVMHGFTSGDNGPGRHAEYYNNTIAMTSNSRNVNRFYWLRAGTAIFTDNNINLPNQGFGDPVLLDMGDNVNPDSYPQERQVGWGHNGTTHVKDPVYIWNNTGSDAGTWDIQSNWTSNIHLNNEFFVNTAKPGYSKYTYPHPLRSTWESGGSTSKPPAAPTNLTIIAQLFQDYGLHYVPLILGVIVTFGWRRRLE